jgi:hypothetical protein
MVEFKLVGFKSGRVSDSSHNFLSRNLFDVRFGGTNRHARPPEVRFTSNSGVTTTPPLGCPSVDSY